MSQINCCATESNFRAVLRFTTIAVLLLSSCQDRSPQTSETATARGTVNGITQAQAESAMSSSKVFVPIGDGSSSVTFIGDCITKDSEGAVQWRVPGKAQFQVSLPYEGNVPRNIISQLIWVSPRGETELGSMSSRPEMRGKKLEYSISLPVYDVGINEGPQKCKIVTKHVVDSKAVILQEGELTINFIKGISPE